MAGVLSPGGRFTSVDPLWELYKTLSPYQYSFNSAMRLRDPSGFVVDWDGWTDEEKTIFMSLVNRVTVLKDMFGNMEKSEKLFTIGYRGSKKEEELAEEQKVDLGSLEEQASYTWSSNPSGGYDGTGTDVYFAFNKENILAAGELDPMASTENNQTVGHSTSIVGHEFFHGGQRSLGIESTERLGFLWIREIQAVAVENSLRASFGLEAKADYGGIQLPTDMPSAAGLLSTIGVNVSEEHEAESNVSEDDDAD